MKCGIFLCVAIILSACSGPASRNKWQKNRDFVEKRNIYYNDFVESGGMIKEENADQVNPMKREIQNALNGGKTVNHIKLSSN
jgi:hypothetical protein